MSDHKDEKKQEEKIARTDVSTKTAIFFPMCVLLTTLIIVLFLNFLFFSIDTDRLHNSATTFTKIKYGTQHSFLVRTSGFWCFKRISISQTNEFCWKFSNKELNDGIKKRKGNVRIGEVAFSLGFISITPLESLDFKVTYEIREYGLFDYLIYKDIKEIE